MDAAFEHVFEPGDSSWTLLLLHGTGGDEHDLIPLGRQLAPQASLLSPRGKVLENGTTPRFFRRLDVGELDVPDLLDRSDELAAFVRESASAYGLDDSRLVAVGLSNGANIAVSMLFRHPDLLRGAILFRPMLPYEPPDLPSLRGAEVLIAAGERDPFTSRSQTERLAEILETGGAAVRAEIAPQAGHALIAADLEHAREWADSHLD